MHHRHKLRIHVPHTHNSDSSSRLQPANSATDLSAWRDTPELASLEGEPLTPLVGDNTADETETVDVGRGGPEGEGEDVREGEDC